LSVVILSLGLFLGALVALVAIWSTRRHPAFKRSVQLSVIVGVIVLTSSALHFALSDNLRFAQRIALSETDPAAAMAGMAEDLQGELDAKPDAQGYFLLGRAREAAGQPREAVKAFARANALSEEPEPDILAAEARARLSTAPPGSESRRIARERARRALDVAPQHMWAHYTLAALLLQDGEAKAAVPHLKAVLDAEVLDPQAQERLRARIASIAPDAAARSTEPAASASAAADGDTPSLSVEIQLAGGRQAQGGVLFVFARHADGPPMPIAARRIVQPEFPMTVTLGDGDRLQPGQPLHSYSQLEIGARWSSTGTATGSGDDPEARMRIDPSSQQEIRLTLTEPGNAPKG